MKLIDKEKVVAEIERLSAYLDSLHEQRIIEKILSSIDTLEPKKVVELDKVCEFLRDYEIKLPNGIIRFGDDIIDDICKILQNET